MQKFPIVVAAHRPSCPQRASVLETVCGLCKFGPAHTVCNAVWPPFLRARSPNGEAAKREHTPFIAQRAVLVADRPASNGQPVQWAPRTRSGPSKAGHSAAAAALDAQRAPL